ncbi:hypothetical protein Kuja_1720 [Vibrio phage vB_VchM_Kuja]|uniref:DUF5675 domain-containing protein n=1 Tax=Vibrio phage vB_VchM_Kuja TaxID=2686437 RepID=A0A6B9J7Y1_9CAUD|nr:hypothetical protein HWC83_gp063 [Vibrio phage vB_VchM_Kuja]QGZ16164.1 hypothetical protein Kuja_1720 [Vibrio phage vB_VchM_Kuja]
MEIYIKRIKELEDELTGKSTLGQLSIEEKDFCVTLEDKFVPLYEKVNGETRIPAGRYPIRKRKVLSNLTKKYRTIKVLKGIFDWHLEICDVPFFENVYIHIGNYAKDTDGCVLVGEKFVIGRAMITNSTKVYIEFYKLVSQALEKDEEVWINIS